MGDHYRPFGSGGGSGGGGGSHFGNKVPYVLHGSNASCSDDGSPDQNVCQAGTAAPVPSAGPNVAYSPQSLGAGGCPDYLIPSQTVGNM